MLDILGATAAISAQAIVHVHFKFNCYISKLLLKPNSEMHLQLSNLAVSAAYYALNWTLKQFP